MVSRRDFLKAGAAGVATLAVGPTLMRGRALAAEQARGIHLAYGADPRSEMTVSWFTASGGTSPPLRLRRAGETAWSTAIDFIDQVSPRYATSVYHHGRLSGLDAGGVYEYVLADAGAPSGSFRLAPSAGSGIRFATVGDMGVSVGAANNTARIAALNPDLVFIVGDLCYAERSGGISRKFKNFEQYGTPTLSQGTWDDWLSQVQPSTRKSPWMIAVGNHEIESGMGDLGYDGYMARMAMPTHFLPSPVTYHSFQVGNVGFVALDANDASYEIDVNRGYTGNAQDAWLASTLASMSADPTVDFIVVGFHHCMYCTNQVHGSDAGPRERWGSLFDQYSVALVVNGHNHSYERTHQLTGGVASHEAPADGIVSASNGVIYVTAGGGGQAVYPTSSHPGSTVTVSGGLRIPEPADWSAVRYMNFSYVRVETTPRSVPGGAKLVLASIGSAGEKIDGITITR